MQEILELQCSLFSWQQEPLQGLGGVPIVSEIDGGSAAKTLTDDRIVIASHHRNKQRGFQVERKQKKLKTTP